MGRIFSFVPDKTYKYRTGILPPLHHHRYNKNTSYYRTWKQPSET